MCRKFKKSLSVLVFDTAQIIIWVQTLLITSNNPGGKPDINHVPADYTGAGKCLLDKDRGQT